MKKAFIIDEGIVRQCASNIAKMNIFEYVYYSIFHWQIPKDIMLNMFKSIKELIEYSVRFITSIIKLILYPIGVIIVGFKEIRYSKEVCLRAENRRG